ncbi:MAG: hypothetical protein AB1801_15040 [Chloroflexota bacterium]
MSQEALYQECPLCVVAPVTLDNSQGVYRCRQCGLTLKSRPVWGLFHKNHFGVIELGAGEYSLAWPGLKNVSLAPEALKVVIGNVYTDEQLAQIAGGNLEVIRPVRTVLAQIILEQLKETCYLQVNGLRRAVGRPLPEGGSYLPAGRTPRIDLAWQDRGNLFGTSKHLVLPSDRFTFVRLDRKLAGVQAFSDGLAVQRQGEEFATYFVGCRPHEAALVAAFVMGMAAAARKPVTGA